MDQSGWTKQVNARLLTVTAWLSAGLVSLAILLFFQIFRGGNLPPTLNAIMSCVYLGGSLLHAVLLASAFVFRRPVAPGTPYPGPQLRISLLALVPSCLVLAIFGFIWWVGPGAFKH